MNFIKPLKNALTPFAGPNSLSLAKIKIKFSKNFLFVVKFGIFLTDIDPSRTIFWFRVPIVPWRNGSLTWLFFIFCQLFAIFEKSSNMANIWQKMKKILVQLVFNTFLHSSASTRYLGFGYPFHHYNQVGHY